MIRDILFHYAFSPFFHCIFSKEIWNVSNSFLNDLLSGSVTVRPLTVTETAEHEDECVLPSSDFLFFPSMFFYFTCLTLFPSSLSLMNMPFFFFFSCMRLSYSGVSHLKGTQHRVIEGGLNIYIYKCLTPVTQWSAALGAVLADTLSHYPAQWRYSEVLQERAVWRMMDGEMKYKVHERCKRNGQPLCIYCPSVRLILMILNTYFTG